jgi:hypothetical protein
LPIFRQRSFSWVLRLREREREKKKGLQQPSLLCGLSVGFDVGCSARQISESNPMNLLNKPITPYSVSGFYEYGRTLLMCVPLFDRLTAKSVLVLASTVTLRSEPQVTQYRTLRSDDIVRLQIVPLKRRD